MTEIREELARAATATGEQHVDTVRNKVHPLLERRQLKRLGVQR